MSVSKSQPFLFFKMVFHESKFKRCKMQWPERHTKSVQYILPAHVEFNQHLEVFF